MLNRLARLLDRGPSLAAFEAEVDRLVDRLRRHVDGLDEPTARKVAHEVATGAISQRELDGVLAWVAR